MIAAGCGQPAPAPQLPDGAADMVAAGPEATPTGAGTGEVLDLRSPTPVQDSSLAGAAATAGTDRPRTTGNGAPPPPPTQTAPSPGAPTIGPPASSAPAVPATATSIAEPFRDPGSDGPGSVRDPGPHRDPGSDCGPGPHRDLGSDGPGSDRGLHGGPGLGRHGRRRVPDRIGNPGRAVERLRRPGAGDRRAGAADPQRRHGPPHPPRRRHPRRSWADDRARPVRRPPGPGPVGPGPIRPDPLRARCRGRRAPLGGCHRLGRRWWHRSGRRRSRGRPAEHPGRRRGGVAAAVEPAPGRARRPAGQPVGCRDARLRPVVVTGDARHRVPPLRRPLVGEHRVVLRRRHDPGRGRGTVPPDVGSTRQATTAT